MQPSYLHRVFVYGTLKKGEPNHYWLTEEKNGKATYIASGKTSIKYPLVIASRYNIPFLLDQPGVGCNVTGEIYEVNDIMLSNLDFLEDHPKFYKRREEEIRSTATGNVTCWAYFLNGFHPYLLNLPLLENYSSSGDHGLVYCEKYLRDPHYNYKSEILVNGDD